MIVQNLFKSKGLNIHLWNYKGYRCLNKSKGFALLYKRETKYNGSLLAITDEISELRLDELIENGISMHEDRKQLKSTVAQSLLVDWLNGDLESLETYRNVYPKEAAFYEANK